MTELWSLIFILNCLWYTKLFYQQQGVAFYLKSFTGFWFKMPNHCIGLTHPSHLLTSAFPPLVCRFVEVKTRQNMPSVQCLSWAAYHGRTTDSSASLKFYSKFLF